MHAAIESDLSPDNIKELVKRADEKYLCALDNDGYTPLHMAVDYKRCQRGQLELVAALVKKENSALDIKTSPPGKLFVYMYHEYTRELFKAQKDDHEGLDHTGEGHKLRGAK